VRFLLFVQVVGFSRILSTAENLVPILLSFYLGSWSDIYGRIPYIAVSMTGKVVQNLWMNTVQAHQLDCQGSAIKGYPLKQSTGLAR
jgi:hypothetical protein